jgi:hypothetical protein
MLSDPTTHPGMCHPRQSIHLQDNLKTGCMVEILAQCLESTKCKPRIWSRMLELHESLRTEVCHSRTLQDRISHSGMCQQERHRFEDCLLSASFTAVSRHRKTWVWG